MTTLTLDYLTDADFRELARIIHRIHARTAARHALECETRSKSPDCAADMPRPECRIGGPPRGDT